jgi:hypothetical protein
MAEGLVKGEGFATDASMIKADAQRRRSCPGEAGVDWGDPAQASRPVREYLAALEQANPVPPPPKRVSLTDPAATWTAAAGPANFCLLDKLPDRFESGDDFRCRGIGGEQNGRGRSHQNDDQSCRREVRRQAAAPGGRYELRRRCNAGLAGRSKKDRSARAGMG